MNWSLVVTDRKAGDLSTGVQSSFYLSLTHEGSPCWFSRVSLGFVGMASEEPTQLVKLTKSSAETICFQVSWMQAASLRMRLRRK